MTSDDIRRTARCQVSDMWPVTVRPVGSWLVSWQIFYNRATLEWSFNVCSNKEPIAWCTSTADMILGSGAVGRSSHTSNINFLCLSARMRWMCDPFTDDCTCCKCLARVHLDWYSNFQQQVDPNISKLLSSVHKQISSSLASNPPWSVPLQCCPPQQPGPGSDGRWSLWVSPPWRCSQPDQKHPNGSSLGTCLYPGMVTVIMVDNGQINLWEWFPKTQE